MNTKKIEINDSWYSYKKIKYNDITTIIYCPNTVIKRQNLFTYDNWILTCPMYEISLLSYINHPNIIKLKSIEIKKKSNVKIGLHFPRRKCTLKELIPDINENKIKKYVYTIASALMYLHKHNIIHRDLKPQNIVYNEKKDRLELIDFDSAKSIYGRYEILTDHMGSLNYRSPELLLGHKNYNSSVDIWSFGCIIYEMLTGEILFKGTSDVDQILHISKIMGTSDIKKLDINKNYKRLPNLLKKTSFFESNILDKFSKEWSILLKGILQVDPSKRISAYDVMNSPLFSEFNDNTFNLHHISLLDNYYLRKLPINTNNYDDLNTRTKNIHAIWSELNFLKLSHSTFFMFVYIIDKVYKNLKHEDRTELLMSCLYISTVFEDTYDSLYTYANIYHMSVTNCKRIIIEILKYIKFDLVYATSYHFLIEYGKLYEDKIVQLAIYLLIYFETVDKRIFEIESHDLALWALYHSTEYYKTKYHHTKFEDIEKIKKIKDHCKLTEYIKTEYDYDLLQS